MDIGAQVKKESDTNDKYSHMQKQMTGCAAVIDQW